MIQLMKLEVKKRKLAGLFRTILITDLVLLLIFLPPFYLDRGNMPNTEFLFFQIMDSMARFAFIIFSGVLTARIVIDEYRDRTIQLLFTYPISREKLIAAKLILTVITTFFALVLARTLLFGTAIILDAIRPFLGYSLAESLTGSYILSSLLYDASASGLCLLIFFFGMRRKSSKQTIIASIVIAMLICGSFGGLSLGATVLTPIIVSGIGAVAAYLSVRNIENEDLV